MNALQTAWADAWRGVGVSDAPPETLAELVVAYDVPDRFYHNTRHVADCLAKLTDYQNAAERPFEIALALFFHDAIYDTHASDNEAQSAAWAVRALRDQNAAGDATTRVYDLILATRHSDAPLAGDAALIADIDLSILGRGWGSVLELRARYPPRVRMGSRPRFRRETRPGSRVVPLSRPDFCHRRFCSA